LRPGMSVFSSFPPVQALEHFQPDWTVCKCSNSLFDRMIHTLRTFRPA
jgi:hypothetical protein